MDQDARAVQDRIVRLGGVVATEVTVVPPAHPGVAGSDHLGRCRACHVVYYWPAKDRVPIANHRCLTCGGPLARTTRNCTDPYQPYPYPGTVRRRSPQES